MTPEDLSPFDVWLVESGWLDSNGLSPQHWPKDAFRYAINRHDDEHRRETLLRGRAHWSLRATNAELSAHEISAIQKSEAQEVTGPVLESDYDHRLHIALTIEHDPQVQEAVARLSKQWQESPLPNEPIESARYRLLVSAFDEAQTIVIDGISASDIAGYMFFSVMEPLAGENATNTLGLKSDGMSLLNRMKAARVRGTTPTIWANPTAVPVTITLDPGAVFVDVTNSVRKDLTSAHWDVIRQVQSRLGGKPRSSKKRSYSGPINLALKLLDRDDFTIPRLWSRVVEEFPPQHRPANETAFSTLLRTERRKRRPRRAS